jgi:hypothetical protein
MSVKIDWRGDEVEDEVDKITLKKLDKSGFLVAGEIVKVITQKGLVDTGLYRASITHEVIPEDLAVRIGSPIGDLANPKQNPPYPLYLEVGTSRGIPAHRPMGTGLANSKSRLQAIWR